MQTSCPVFDKNLGYYAWVKGEAGRRSQRVDYTDKLELFVC